ncbi:ATP-dependent RNA helicase DBP3 [Cryptococcus depauperatus CBS 7841]|uniref:RNA helicase n=1 Tax=Cryptococcus depauperatus CBS 7841 TaxID=1295531 RepID=A0A1E3IRN7_9TREE|nr:ATP-dependent RNA helicase DBP3 [Cryptococcus depauperatus CBS 7841]
MSVEEVVSTLSKEEKKARKEAKKLKKADKAAKQGVTLQESTADVVEAVKEEKESKKEKSDTMAEKVGEDVETTKLAAESTKEVKDKADKKERKDKKKEKKDKKRKEAGVEDDERPEEPPKKKKKSKDEPIVETFEDASALSKKKQKKLAKAEAAVASASAAPPASISTVFTTEHNTFLSSNAITLTPPLYPPFLAMADLPVHENVQAFLKKFTKPTPIQACSWPALLAKRDVVGIAETGSGKTLAFGVPGANLLTHLPPVSSKKPKRGPAVGQVQMLVVAPTRELAQQSHETLTALGAQVKLKSVCIFGGVGKEGQVKSLSDRDVRIVVGTPGRLLDLTDQGELDLSSISYLVLDEADRMLDAGFENDIRKIIAHTPDHSAGRQTVMFSATWPESVRRLASSFLNDPVRITVGSDELSANKRIEQFVEVLDSPRDKDARLIHHLRSHLKAYPNSAASPTRILVFALYKKEAQRLEYTIRRGGYAVGALHGDMTQDARFKALDLFKTGKQNVLVATDVAARGLDIPDVGLVINVTFPLTTEDFVHRCGRTGRAGKTGKAVTFFTGENHEKSLAGEFMRVLRDAGAQIPKEMDRFPTTIKKKEHGSYGAFYKDTSTAPAPTKITFD